MAAPAFSMPAFATFADLLEYLGDIPPERIRLKPPPGTATEQDVIEIEAHEDLLCELVYGTLVEKPMGFLESRLASVLGYFLETYLDKDDLGITAGEAGMIQLELGLVRIPDLSFISWERLPDSKVPDEPIPDLTPDLVVEVLSKGNTKKEMERKLDEYFSKGVRLVWYIDPTDRTVRVFTSPRRSRLLHESDTLEGGKVLPGFSLPLKQLFDRALQRRRRK